MPSIGTPELIIVLAIALLLFGGKKLPELARSLGTSVKEVRKGFNDAADDQKGVAASKKQDA